MTVPPVLGDLSCDSATCASELPNTLHTWAVGMCEQCLSMTSSFFLLFLKNKIFCIPWRSTKVHMTCEYV